MDEADTPSRPSSINEEAWAQLSPRERSVIARHTQKYLEEVEATGDEALAHRNLLARLKAAANFQGEFEK